MAVRSAVRSVRSGRLQCPQWRQKCQIVKVAKVSELGGGLPRSSDALVEVYALEFLGKDLSFRFMWSPCPLAAATPSDKLAEDPSKVSAVTADGVRSHCGQGGVGRGRAGVVEKGRPRSIMFSYGSSLLILIFVANMLFFAIQTGGGVPPLTSARVGPSRLISAAPRLLTLSYLHYL